MKKIADNKRAHFDYDLGETIVAGLVLTGPEVKSAKSGHMSVKGSFVAIHDGEAFLTNAHINPYAFALQPNYDPTMSRKLLLHRKQLDELIGLKQAGWQLVVLSAGLERGRVKVVIAPGRSKKQHDKRQSIKRREHDRDIARSAK
jgi:SsrA-binding protein